MLMERLRRRRASAPTAADLEQQQLQQRYTAWQQADAPGRPDWPPAAPRVFDASVGVPDIPAAELTDEALADGLLNHGAIIVRGLFPAAAANELSADIDRVVGLLEQWRAGEPIDGDAGGQAAWFRRLTEPNSDQLVGQRWREVNTSNFSGECPVVDSPHVAAKILPIYEQSGVIDRIANFLGERPALSLEKWVLRRVPPTANTSWHQDGAFLGKTIRSVNVWVALNECGVDACGLDIVAKRFDDIVETGTKGAYFTWDVGQGVVDEVRGESEIVSPEFAPGDAVIFDQFLLHRTGVKPEMSKDRYALEGWFFAPSHFPDRYNGILL